MFRFECQSIPFMVNIFSCLFFQKNLLERTPQFKQWCFASFINPNTYKAFSHFITSKLVHSYFDPCLLFIHCFPHTVSSFACFSYCYGCYFLYCPSPHLAVSLFLLSPLVSNPLFSPSLIMSPELWAADSCGGWKLHPFHKPSWWVSLYDIAQNHAEGALDTENE